MAPRFGSGFFINKMMEEAEELNQTEGESKAEAGFNAEGSTSASSILDNSTSNMEYMKTFSMFAVMGAGANWVFPSALAQQIPYFQRYQPEGLCIATYMNATTNLGIIAVIIYFLTLRYVGPIPHSYAVPTILFFSAFGCYLAAAVHSVTVNGMSLFLFLCCAIGGAVGATSSVVMNPFLTNFKSDFISASRSGGSGCILLAALVALAQSPGDRERFSTSSYLLVFGLVLSIPIFSYLHITRKGIGRRRPIEGGPSSDEWDGGGGGGYNTDTIYVIQKQRSLSRDAEDHDNENENHGFQYSDYTKSEREKERENDIEMMNMRPSLRSTRNPENSDTIFVASAGNDEYQQAYINMNKNANLNIDIYEKVTSQQTKNKYTQLSEEKSNYGNIDFLNDNNTYSSNTSSNYSKSDFTVSPMSTEPNTTPTIQEVETETGTETGGGFPKHGNEFNDYDYIRSNKRHTIASWILPNYLLIKYPWLHEALPLCLVVGMVNFNTWGMITALSPFAFKNVTTDGGASCLALAYELGGICLVLGDLSTTKFHLPIWVGLVGFFVCTSAIYFAAANIPFFQTHSFDSSLLIICFAFGRFFEAQLVTQSYRIIAQDFNRIDRENAARAVGLTDQCSTTFGSILSTLLVAKYAVC